MKHTFFFLLLGLFIAALAFLAFWMIGRSSVNPDRELLISNVSLSVDFADHQFLAGTVFRFPYGTKQICLKFDYSRLEKDIPIEIVWDWEDKRAQMGNYTLSEPSGTRMYSLRKRDGSPLPKGSYSVTIQCGQEVRPKFHFEIY